MTTQKTKQQMIKEMVIANHNWTTKSAFNKRTAKEISKLYAEGIACGVIKSEEAN
jgi:hypothetical protein